MPATKLMKIRKAVMRQKTKISGGRDILLCAVIMAAITMPAKVFSQAVPDEKEWVVVIDAGHGGKDPGSIGYSKSKEKNINLAVALKTGKYISENLKDVKVVYTRDNDTFLGLDERAAVANKHKADLFISIHSNAWKDKQPHGIETYVFGPTQNEANLKVAMKENSVITFEEDYETKYEGYDPNSVESFIIFSLMQNTYLKQSTEYASLLQDQFRDRVGRFDRGVKQAGFVVLWRSTMPSVLIELGFITNPAEEKYLVSAEGQDYLASAIYRSFRDYKHTIDSRSGVASKTKVANEPAPAVIRTDAADSSNELVLTASASAPAATQAPKSTAKPAVNTLFMVQIAAAPAGSTAKQPDFNGIETVTRIVDGERIKFGAGKFTDYEKALDYRRSITSTYPDAFVIAVKDGKIIPLKEAIDATENKKQ